MVRVNESLASPTVPCCCGNMPVYMLARLAAQIGEATKVRSKRMPSAASRSMFGVFTTGF